MWLIGLVAVVAVLHTSFVSNHPFVVPVGCHKVLAVVPQPLRGVVVTATKIAFLGQLESLPAGGRGVVPVADPAAVPAPGLGNGDLNVGNGTDLALIRSGADLCDDPAANLTGNGNNNGVSDGSDFPCSLAPAGFPALSFPDQLALAAACADLVPPPGAVNTFQAFNDPLIIGTPKPPPCLQPGEFPPVSSGVF
jgi:hypothetical protein